MKDQDLGKFLRLLAHDLQNQLGAIDLNLQVIPTLVDENDSAMKTIAPFLTRAALASNDMIETLTDIQTYARQVSPSDDAAENTQPLTAIDLGHLVQDCGLALSSSAHARGLTLTTAAGAGVMAAGHIDDIRRSLKILATDLFRTSFPGSSISIEALMIGGRPAIELRSTQEGLFDETRLTLSLYLATRLIEHSSARFEMPNEVNGPSLLRFVFQPI